jgi:hypothetical protein
MLPAILLLAANLAGPPPPKDYPGRIERLEKTMDGIASDTLWIGSSAAADLFTTAWALRECPSCAEGNPLGFSVESRIALKAGGTVVALGACYKLRRDGHHRSAAILRWTVTAVQFALAVNNSYHAIAKK